MIVRDLNDDQLVEAYGTGYKQLYPFAGEDFADWGVAKWVIPPAGETEPHSHDEREMFILLSGAGEMLVGEERRMVAAPCAVLLPELVTHQLLNASQTESLAFLSVYWPPEMGALEL
jgi:mannose-6-phosphate isomerase-like protein (cupin superfamily)